MTANRTTVRPLTKDDVVEFCGHTRSIAQRARDTGVSQPTIIAALTAGRSVAALLGVPTMKNRAPGDLTGQRFNLLTVPSPGVSTPKDRYWLSVCDCGGLANVRVTHLLDGRTKSCGHVRAEWGRSPKTHGQPSTGRYRKWTGMVKLDRQRPVAQVRERWSVFDTLAADMGATFASGVRRPASGARLAPSCELIRYDAAKP